MNWLTWFKGAMGKGRKILRFKTSLLIILILLLSVLVFSGCRAGLGAVPKGWSGGTIADDILFVGSMKGKLVASNMSEGSLLWEEFLVSLEPSGGGFGCAPTTASSVAIYGSPAVGKGLVYVGGYNGIVYAFAFGGDAPRGEPRWVYPRQGDIGGHIVGGLVVAEDKVYFGTSVGEVYALDAIAGFKEWAFKAGDKIWSTPAVDGDTLYIGCFDDKLYALRTADGTKKWEFVTEGAIVATPVVDNNTVYVGSFDRYLYALDAVDGSLKWKFLAGNWFWAKPVIYDGVVYTGCLDGKVYGLDAKSGDKLVEFDLKKPIASSPVLVDNKLLVVATEIDNDKDDKSEVYTLDTTNDQQRELVTFKEEVSAPLIAHQGKVYIHTDKDKLYELNAQSGAIREFRLGSD